MNFKKISLLLALAMTWNLTSNAEPAVEIPEDVRQFILSYQDDAILTRDKDPEVVAALNEKVALPEWKLVIDGYALTRDQIVARMRAKKGILESCRNHHQQLTRVGNTIVVHGLFDQVQIVDGKPVTTRNSGFTETFILHEGQWRLLLTYWTTKEVTKIAGGEPLTPPSPAAGN